MSPSGTFRPTGQCESSTLSKNIAELQQYCMQRSISLPAKNPPGKVFKNDYIAAVYLYDMGFEDKDVTLREDSRRLLLSLLPLNKPDMVQKATEICDIPFAGSLTKGKICEVVLATILDNGEVPGPTRAAATETLRQYTKPVAQGRAYVAAAARYNDHENTRRLSEPKPIDTHQRPTTSTSAQGARSQKPSEAPSTPKPSNEQQQSRSSNVDLPDGYSPNQDLEKVKTTLGFPLPTTTPEDVKRACIRITNFSIKKWPSEFPELAEARNHVQWVMELVDVCRDFSKCYSEIQQKSQESETNLTKVLEKVVAASDAMSRQTDQFTRQFAEIMSRSPCEKETLSGDHVQP